MNRMRCGLVCMTSELVRMPSPKNRTPSHQRAVGDAGGREDDVLAAGEVRRPVDPLEVGNAHRAAALLVLGLVDHETGEDLAVQAAHRRRRQHPFRRAAGAHHGVHTAAGDGGGNTGRQVAIADQPDARAGRAESARSAPRGAAGRARPPSSSSTWRPSARAMARRFSRTGASRSTRCFELGPTTSFSM